LNEGRGGLTWESGLNEGRGGLTRKSGSQKGKICGIGKKKAGNAITFRHIRETTVSVKKQ
jgi:hypothetical protein